MRKYILIATVLSASCKVDTSSPQRTEYVSSGVQPIRIDSCEYITYWSDCIIHKGNCDNPIHNK